jgi:hypothetical protein
MRCPPGRVGGWSCSAVGMSTGSMVNVERLGESSARAWIRTHYPGGWLRHGDRRMVVHGRRNEIWYQRIELEIFECERFVGGKWIFLEPIGIKFRRRPKCALDPLPDELAVEQDTAADKANPDFVRGSVAVDLFHPEFELGRRPFSRIGREHGVVRHGRF